MNKIDENFTNSTLELNKGIREVFQTNFIQEITKLEQCIK